MASLRRLLQRFSASTAPIEPVESTVSSTPIREKLLTSILGPFEAYVVSIQSILIWEKPYASAVAVTLANILFWLGVYCRYRVYFILISIAAIAFVYRAWVNQIWPEIRVPIPEEEDLEEWTPVHPQVLSVPEISRYLSNMCALGKNWYTWLINMRSEKPSAFFGLMMGTFSILAIIGHHIPGVAIVYTLVMAMMLGPGFMLHVYPNILQYLPSPASLALIMLAQEGKRVHETEQAHDCSGIDEFLPEPSQDNLDALQMPLDISHDEPSSMLIAEELGMHEMIGHGD